MWQGSGRANGELPIPDLADEQAKRRHRPLFPGKRDSPGRTALSPAQTLPWRIQPVYKSSFAESGQLASQEAEGLVK
jgi:hypothetical protein